MTESEFKNKLEKEQLFYGKKISINQGIVQSIDSMEVFGCTQKSADDKTWYIFESFFDWDRFGEYTIIIGKNFSEEEKAFDYFYSKIKSYMNDYKKENHYIQKMSRDELISRMKTENPKVNGYYISFEEGIIDRHKEKGEPKSSAKCVIGCSKPENGNCYQVFYSSKFSDDEFYLYILKKFKSKESEKAFAFFYNYITSEEFRKVGYYHFL